MITKLLSVMMLAAVIVTITGCNTVEGVGKDTQRAGEHIENAADHNK